MSDVRAAVSLDAEALLSDFGKYIGLPGLTFGEQGFVGLMFDDHALNILYDGARDAFLVYGPIGAVPTGDERFFRRLLAECHYSIFNGQGALTIDEQHAQVVWSETVPLSDLTQERFQEKLKAAVDQVEFLKGSLFEALVRPEAPTTLPAGDGEERFVRI